MRQAPVEPRPVTLASSARSTSNAPPLRDHARPRTASFGRVYDALRGMGGPHEPTGPLGEAWAPSIRKHWEEYLHKPLDALRNHNVISIELRSAPCSDRITPQLPFTAESVDQKNRTNAPHAKSIKYESNIEIPGSALRAGIGTPRCGAVALAAPAPAQESRARAPKPWGPTRTSRAPSSWTCAIPNPTGGRSRRRKRPTAHRTSCSCSTTTPESPRGRPTVAGSICRRSTNWRKTA